MSRVLRLLSGIVVVATALIAVPASPAAASSSGCTGHTVCIYVAGSGLHVDSVGGGVSVPGGVISGRKWCGTVKLGVNNVVVARSPHGCATTTSPFQHTFPVNRNYPDGTKLCLIAATDAGGYYNPGTGGACEHVEK